MDDKKERAKLGYFVNLLPGFSFKSDEFSSNPSDLKLLRGANIGVNAIKWEDVVYWPNENSEQLHIYLLKAGDIVF